MTIKLKHLLTTTLVYSLINSLQDAQNHRKSSYTNLHRLTKIHHRQAVQQRTQKQGYRFVSPGGQGFIARRFLQEPRKHSHGHAPPGGYVEPARQFLEIFQKFKFHKVNSDYVSRLSYYSWN